MCTRDIQQEAERGSGRREDTGRKRENWVQDKTEKKKKKKTLDGHHDREGLKKNRKDRKGNGTQGSSEKQQHREHHRATGNKKEHE